MKMVKIATYLHGTIIIKTMMYSYNIIGSLTHEHWACYFYLLCLTL